VKGRMILALLCIGLAFGALADDVITITYANWQFLEPARSDVLKEFIAKFEQQYPNIRVEQMAIPYGTYNDAIATQFEAGAGPDILFVQDMALIPWLEQGYFASLNDLIDLSEYEGEFPEQEALAVRNGEVYAIIYEGFPYNALIINKRLLDEAGVDIPKTPEELIAASNAVYDTTGAFGLIHPTNCSNRSYIMQGGMIVIEGFGGRIVKDGHFAVNDPEFVQGVEFLKQIFDSRGTPVGMMFGQQRNAFLAGQAAMVLDGSYWPSIVRGAAPEVYKDLVVVHTPFPDQAGPFETNWYAISANSDRQHQEAAAKFLEFLLAPEQANKWARISAIPGLKFTYQAVLEENPWFQVYADVAPNGIPRPLPGYEAQTLEIRKMVADYICYATLGQMSPQEAMDELQRKLIETFGAQ